MDPASGEKLYFWCVRCSPPRRFEQLKLLIGHYNLIHAPEGQYILRPETKSVEILGRDGKVLESEE